jgi:hypothetical protein
MAKINISIELNERELENLLEGENDEYDDDDCECDCNESYTKEEMLAANIDELEWYKKFFAKYSNLFNDITNKDATLARYDLLSRIEYGEKVIKNIEEQ